MQPAMYSWALRSDSRGRRRIEAAKPTRSTTLRRSPRARLRRALARVTAGAMFAPAIAHAQSAAIDRAIAEPEHVRRDQGTIGIAVRAGLQRGELVEETASDFYRVLWLSRGFHAPFVGVGGTASLGGVVYADPTRPDGQNAALRFSTGPSVRIGYGATFGSDSMITSADGSRGDHDWFVALSLSPVIIAAVDVHSTTLPERNPVFGFRAALTFAAPLWPHRQETLEDYAVIFSMLVPALVEVSLEVIPGDGAVRPGLMIGWTL